MIRATKSKHPRTAKRKIGRPTLYSAKLAKLICDRISHGATIPEICAADGMPHHDTVYGWVETKPGFSEALARARRAGAPALVDRAWAAADDGTRDVLEQRDADGKLVRLIPNHASVKRDELRVNQLRYMAGVADPATYGPKQQIEVSGHFISELQTRMDEVSTRLERERHVIDVVPAPLPMPAVEHRPIVREPEPTAEPAKAPLVRKVDPPPQERQSDRNAIAQAWYVESRNRRSGQGG